MPIRKIIQIDEDLCNGCGQCVPNCAEGALDIVDGKARIVKDMYCDGLGACLGHCPTGALTIIEREAVDFDEEAAMEFVAKKNEQHAHKPMQPLGMHGGCPGSAMRTFAAAKSAAEPIPGGSRLTHWPIKLKLVPPTAPFLKDADLLIAADCVPGAMPDFHARLLEGKVMVMACPKFGEVEEAYEKLKAIFKHSGVRSVTVADMEVPCCSALPAMARQAMVESGRKIPFEDVVLSLAGEIKSRRCE